MLVLDASALIAFLRGEPAGETVRSLLATGEATVPSVNLAESIDVLWRRHGVERARLQAVLDPLLAEVIRVVPVGTGEAWRAADLRAAFYDRAAPPLSLADCLLLACVREGDRVVTADGLVADVARREHLEVIAL